MSKTLAQRPRVDKRGSIPRKLARIRKALVADLEQPLSAADDAMLRAAALAIHRVNELEAQIMCGAVIDDDQLTRLLNATTRILSTVVGKSRKRSKRDVSLDEYLASEDEE